jgi:GNAT superfamily N-acetyltransferase
VSTDRPRLRPARESEAGPLTELAMRSKAHWGYDDVFLAASRLQLTMVEGEIAANRTVLAEQPDTGRVLGFGSLEGEPPQGVIGMLFVEPEAIGQGVGRLLFGHLLAEARRLGFARLTIAADPNAEPFYRVMGAVTIGRVPSGAVPGRTLPLMSVDVGAPAG